MKKKQTNHKTKTQTELNYLLTQQGISSCKINCQKTTPASYTSKSAFPSLCVPAWSVWQLCHYLQPDAGRALPLGTTEFNRTSAKMI